MLKIATISQDGFGIEPSLQGNRLILKLTGTGDMIAVALLRNCLTDAHQEVKRLELTAVEIDIRALYLLNSSCLKALVSFLYTIQTEGPPYAVEFITDPHLSWQQRALSPLERMAPSVVSVRDA